jgi:hypothetical protein
MAGSSVTVSRTTRDIAGTRKKEANIALVCVSDNANGTVPNQTLLGLGDYVLTEVKPTPHGVTPPTAAFSLIIVDADGSEIFDSGNIAVGATDIIGGQAGHPAGHYPRMEDSVTVKLVTTADHSVAANLGNTKTVTFDLRLELK